MAEKIVKVQQDGAVSDAAQTVGWARGFGDMLDFHPSIAVRLPLAADEVIGASFRRAESSLARAAVQALRHFRD